MWSSPSKPGPLHGTICNGLYEYDQGPRPWTQSGLSLFRLGPRRVSVSLTHTPVETTRHWISAKPSNQPRLCFFPVLRRSQKHDRPSEWSSGAALEGELAGSSDSMASSSATEALGQRTVIASAPLLKFALFILAY